MGSQGGRSLLSEEDKIGPSVCFGGGTLLGENNG